MASVRAETSGAVDEEAEVERIWRLVTGEEDSDSESEEAEMFKHHQCVPEDESKHSKSVREAPATASVDKVPACGTAAYDTTGQASSSTALEALTPCPQDSQWRWERCRFAEGLWLCRGFLDPQQQQALLDVIEKDRWFDPPQQNQFMCFGSMPPVAMNLSSAVRSAALGHEPPRCNVLTCPRCTRQPCLCPSFTSTKDGASHGCNSGPSSAGSHQEWEKQVPGHFTGGSSSSTNMPLPGTILSREPLFDQMIANWYSPEHGIKPHVDLLRFADGIAVVSFVSPCVMSFSPVKVSGGSSECSGQSHHGLLLNPGDLLLMHGEARYDWAHGIIRDSTHQQVDGRPVPLNQRISITLRKLMPDLSTTFEAS